MALLSRRSGPASGHILEVVSRPFFRVSLFLAEERLRRADVEATGVHNHDDAIYKGFANVHMAPLHLEVELHSA